MLDMLEDNCKNCGYPLELELSYYKTKIRFTFLKSIQL